MITNYFHKTSLLAILMITFTTSALTQRHGIEIDSVKISGSNGALINYAQENGVLVTRAIKDGIKVGVVNEDGVSVGIAGKNGFDIFQAGEDGISVQSSGADGIYVGDSGDDGVHIEIAERNGIYVNDAALNGLYVLNADTDGVWIENAGSYGYYVGNAGLDGVHINYADDDGVHINYADDDGVEIFNAGGDGLYVQHANNYSMNIQGNKNESGGPDAHIAQIYNRNNQTSPDVLALKVGKLSNPGGGVNFISFYDGDNDGVGRIEGNGSGGVLYGTSGSDFAECLPRSTQEDIIESGDIVGVFQEKISHETSQAIQLMVITDRPAVLGNQQEEVGQDEMVSFIGQVPVKVIGPVEQGDWIIPSGKHDGIGRAIHPDKLTLDHRIVGKAWASNLDPTLKKVNVAVGLDQSDARDIILKNMATKLNQQEATAQKLQAQISELKTLLIAK